MGNKKEITFTQAVEVKDHNGAVEFSAQVGDCVDLVDASAARWVNRRKAVYGKLETTDDIDDALRSETETEEAMKKAVEGLSKAKERYQAAYTAHQKKADNKTVKELGLASKHQANKQQEYDALVEASEKE